jgi:pyruvate/2-oxoglutarate dehydrogenase complex dihydrolipoamide acyltransferase (E2) component
MRREILMPTLSEEVEEGVLVTWFVAPGASVRAGDLVAEVQVEKVSEEVRAPADGCLVEALVGQGEVVRQGAPIAVLDVGAAEAVEPRATRPAVPAAVPPAEAAAPALASPAARRLARELGVDLAALSGRGPGGRVVEADVREAATAGVSEKPAAAAEAEPLSLMRRTIATRLTAGLREAAQLTLTAEADATDLAAELARLGALAGRRPSYTAAVVRASALALRDHPPMARRWSDEGLVPAAAIDIGVAVAVDDGLVVPVLRAADRKGLDRLSEEVRELAERTRARSITSQETQGAVMSVTSLGAHRIDAFTPLLDLPQSAILGVGRVRPRPAVVDGQVVARMLMVLSLTIDHRVVDGEPAAAFLDQVIALLEKPSGLA